MRYQTLRRAPLAFWKRMLPHPGCCHELLSSQWNRIEFSYTSAPAGTLQEWPVFGAPVLVTMAYVVRFFPLHGDDAVSDPTP